MADLLNGANIAKPRAHFRIAVLMRDGAQLNPHGWDEPPFTALGRRLIAAAHLGAMEPEVALAVIRELTMRLQCTLRENPTIAKGTGRDQGQ